MNNKLTLFTKLFQKSLIPDFLLVCQRNDLRNISYVRTHVPKWKVLKSTAMPRLFSSYSPRFGFIGWVLAILDCNDSKLGYLVLKQSCRNTFNSFYTEPLCGIQIKLETIQSKSLSPKLSSAFAFLYFVNNSKTLCLSKAPLYQHRCKIACPW